MLDAPRPEAELDAATSTTTSPAPVEDAPTTSTTSTTIAVDPSTTSTTEPEQKPYLPGTPPPGESCG